MLVQAVDVVGVVVFVCGGGDRTQPLGCIHSGGKVHNAGVCGVAR